MQDWAVKYIRHVLKEKGWTAVQLAKASDVSPSTITRPLSQDDYPHKFSRTTIQKVFQASRIDPEPFANSNNECFFQENLSSGAAESVQLNELKTNEACYDEVTGHSFLSDDGMPKFKAFKFMDLSIKEHLARTRDTSRQAIGLRLRVARMATGFKQKEFATLLQLKTQTYNSQEINGTPSIHVMRYLLEGHRIDFNFILHGDFVQLPGDVQDVLFEILSGEK